MAQKFFRDYPHLVFKKRWELTYKSYIYIGQCEAYVNAIRNTPILPDFYEQLKYISLKKGAQATTAIEGNTLSDSEIDKVIKKEQLPPSKEYQQIEVSNILNAMNSILVEVLDSKEQFITAHLLRRFHRLIGANLGDNFAAIPGRIREHDVVVAKYRCPDHRDVPGLLDELCQWLPFEFKFVDGGKRQDFIDIVIEAIVTHIYIEWIHPFGDGNGRMGRLIEFYILLRGGLPDIASHILSNHYNETRSEYYRQIEKATNTGDLSAFIEYALLGLRDGLVQTLERIQISQFTNTWQKLIFDKFDVIRHEKRVEAVFKRQRNLALYIPIDREFRMHDIPDLNVQLAKQYSNAADKTLHRDLDLLLQLKLIIRQDNGSYKANTDSLRGMTAQINPVGKKEILT